VPTSERQGIEAGAHEATLISMQSIPTAIAQACHRGNLSDFP
jgi:hypothetical protein